MRAVASNIMILTKQSKPYTIEGRSGVSYKADILSDNSVSHIKLTEDVFNQIECKHAYNLILDIYIGFKSTSVKAVDIITK